MEKNIIVCPACQSQHSKNEEEWKAYTLVTCSDCGLTFTRNPNPGTKHYVGLYEDSQQSFTKEVEYTYTIPLQRLYLEQQAYFAPRPRLTPAERTAIKWLKENVPSNSVVIDCGCGTGRTLQALRYEKIRAVGVEVSPDLVETLNSIGLKAIHGEAPNFPWTDATPFAITFFEVLEHLADPAVEIAPLRERFPQTHIIATIPSPNRIALKTHERREPTDYPPHHFLRWTPEALKAFFHRIGYSKVEVIIPPPSGFEVLDLAPVLYRNKSFQKIVSPHSESMNKTFPLSRTNPIKKLTATLILWISKLQQFVLETVGKPRASLLAKRGVSSGSMVVIASP